MEKANEVPPVTVKNKERQYEARRSRESRMPLTAVLFGLRGSSLCCGSLIAKSRRWRARESALRPSSARAFKSPGFAVCAKLAPSFVLRSSEVYRYLFKPRGDKTWWCLVSAQRNCHRHTSTVHRLHLYRLCIPAVVSIHVAIVHARCAAAITPVRPFHNCALIVTLVIPSQSDAVYPHLRFPTAVLSSSTSILLGCCRRHGTRYPHHRHSRVPDPSKSLPPIPLSNAFPPLYLRCRSTLPPFSSGSFIVMYVCVQYINIVVPSCFTHHIIVFYPHPHHHRCLKQLSSP